MSAPTEDWEGIWKTLQPGQRFDKGISAPVLSLLPTSQALPSGADLSVLIPGCGRGYDVVFLASHARFGRVVGMEISPTAAATARAYLAEQGVDASKAEIVSGDFFDTSVASGPFDVAFDYTFFCAMHPTRRQAWAAAYAARLRPGAVLVTLMYPVGKDMQLGGPPFGVSPEAYETVLVPEGFVCVDGPRVMSDEEAAEGRGGGKSIWAIWKRV